jgi:hypothetical protein
MCVCACVRVCVCIYIYIYIYIAMRYIGEGVEFGRVRHGHLVGFSVVVFESIRNTVLGNEKS